MCMRTPRCNIILYIYICIYYILIVYIIYRYILYIYIYYIYIYINKYMCMRTPTCKRSHEHFG